MILSIDASTTGCSVALIHEFDIVSSLSSRVERSAAEKLTLMIESVLNIACVAYQDLEAVAVAKGPGSYTGLRIATSTAKGLAYGLNIPILSYGTLPAMCSQIPFRADLDLLCPMIDARRMEVFCGFYDAVNNSEVHPVSAELLNEDSFYEILGQKKVLFFGEGSAKFKAIQSHKNAFFLEQDRIYPNAVDAVELVSNKFLKGDFEDITTFEPFYLKEYMFKTKN